jgi:hypothetical protein
MPRYVILYYSCASRHRLPAAVHLQAQTISSNNEAVFSAPALLVNPDIDGIINRA